MNGSKIALQLAAAALIGKAMAVTTLPLPQNGLVAHLDASREETFTLGEGNRVVEWRSLTDNGFKYGMVDGQSDTAVPYWSESSRVGGIAGVTFGFDPSYEYAATADDRPQSKSTYLTANMAVSNRTVILVFQSLNNSSDNRTSPLFAKNTRDINHGAIFHKGNYSAGSIAAASFYGTTGLAWLNGELVYDYAHRIGQNIDNPAGRLFDLGLTTLASPKIHVLISQIVDETDTEYTTQELTPLFVSSLGRANSDAKLCAVISEVIVYDRLLLDVERRYIEQTLAAKWKGQTAPICWTGAGADANWSTAANWSTGVVPGATDEIFIAGAMPTVDVNARIARITMLGGASVNVAQRLDLVVPAGVTHKLSGTFAGTGAFGKSGDGKLEMTAEASVASTLTLGVDSGVIDLNGGAWAFAGVTGGAVVTNGALSAATLTVGGTSDMDLDARLCGRIRLVKAGAGKLRVAGAQAYDGATELGAGTFEVVTNLAVNAIPGLVVHLDASRADTIVEDGDGYIASWRSLVGDDIVFKPIHALTKNANYAPGGTYYGVPYYSRTGVGGGLPGVQFGLTKEGTSQYGGLAVGNKTVRNRSVVIVQQNVPDYEKAHEAYGNYCTSYNDPQRDRRLLQPYYNNNYGFKMCAWSAYTNSVYLNARTVWSVDKYVAGEAQDDYFEFSNAACKDQPFVISVVVPDEYAWQYEDFKPAVGCAYAYHDGDNGGAAAIRYKGLVCEVLVFDRELSDAERRTIETHLMNKWIKSPRTPYRPGELSFENMLPENSQLLITGSATLAGCRISDFAGLTVRVSDETVPTLTVAGDADVTRTDLVLEGLSSAAQGTILQTSGALTGPFKSVSPDVSGRQKVKYTPKSVLLKVLNGLMLIFR